MKIGIRRAAPIRYFEIEFLVPLIRLMIIMITRNIVVINMTSKRSEIAIAIKIQLEINSSGFSGYFIILILIKFIISIDN